MYAALLELTNFPFPTSNFSVSFSEFVKAFVTRIPEIEDSRAALISATYSRLFLNASRILTLSESEMMTRSGTQAKTMSVSGTFMLMR